MNQHGTAPNKVRAHATTKVRSYKANTYSRAGNGQKFLHGHLEEDFEGDIQAYGVVDTLQAVISDTLTYFTGIQKLSGTVKSRKGTFLLHVTGVIQEKKVQSEWTVIQGSGTGELMGLRGEGGFTAQLGEGGTVHLDYWYEHGDRG